MRTTVYPNTENFVMSDRNKQPLSAAVSNVLHLSDAERIKITQIFLRKIPLCCLTQRAAKIVTAVFSQTIDFNKFEDDMNGCRLQQLTNLFPQHANEVVRYLEAIHVLITREGSYGKYLSINFNFSQWGKEKCGGIITNDPTIMLDKESFIADHSPEHLEKIENIEKSRRNPANHAFEPISPLPPQSTPHAYTPPDYSQDLLKDVLTAIGRIEGNVNDLSKRQENIEQTLENKLEHLIQKVTQPLFASYKREQQAELEKTLGHLIEKVMQPLFATYKREQQAELEKTLGHLIEKEVAKRTAHLIEKVPQPQEKQIEPQAAKTSVTKPTNEPVIEAVVEAETAQQPIEKSRPSQHIATTLPTQIPAKPLTEIPTESAVQTSSLTALQFPSKLNQDQCYDAKKLLQRVEDDKKQILLDMLSKRMQNTADPVKKPIAYLTNLVTRLANDRLDMPSTTVSNAPAEPRPLRQSERCRAEYQEAVADCMQMEQNVKLLARNDSLTFAECLDKFDLRGLWDSIRQRFTETKEALAEVQQFNEWAV